jgi:hypothetical protein
MGPYCQYCGHRCFLERRLPGTPGTVLLATCPGGMAHDIIVTGYDHTTVRRR